MVPLPKQSAKSNSRQLWRDRGIALLATLNLVLVLFDLSYLSLRSLYLQAIPSLVQVYDPIKGIHSHPETQRYLAQVDRLESQLIQTGVESPDVESSLAELRQYSDRFVEDDSFAQHDQDILETIQYNLQSRTGANSAFEAFDRFWSQAYLAQAGWQSELNYWRYQIQPLLQSNYYRRVNRFGYAIDYFWLIDLPFILFFAIEFALRIQAIHQRYPELSRLEVILRRWYDLFLLIPVWRWLRAVPVLLRLHQTQLLDLKPLQAEVQRDFAIGFAKELTEVVGVRAINRVQAAVRRGEVMQWLLYPELRRTYVQINDRNEMSAIAAQIADVSIHQVLPQMQGEIEAVIEHGLHQILFEQLPGYRQLAFLPGFGNLRGQTTERLSKSLSKSAYQGLEQLLTDPAMAKLSAQLVQNFGTTLAIELQKQPNTQAIEKLLVDLLEEIKINYIQSLTEEEMEQIIEEAEHLQRQGK